MLWLMFGLTLGLLTGLFAFRIKSRWCPECGATTTSLTEWRRLGGRAEK